MAIQFLRGTKSACYDYAPAAGQPIYTTDTGELFVGDGTTSVSQLHPMLTTAAQELSTTQKQQVLKNIGAATGVQVNDWYIDGIDSDGRLTVGTVTRQVRFNGTTKSPNSTSGVTDLGNIVQQIKFNGTTHSPQKTSGSDFGAVLLTAVETVGGVEAARISMKDTLYCRTTTDIGGGKNITLASIVEGDQTVGRKLHIAPFTGYHNSTGGESDEYTIAFPTGYAYAGYAFWTSGYANSHDKSAGVVYGSVASSTTDRTLATYTLHNKAKSTIVVVYWRTDISD